jgi:hypothetical protein
MPGYDHGRFCDQAAEKMHFAFEFSSLACSCNFFFSLEVSTIAKWEAIPQKIEKGVSSLEL